jgi:D-xylose 1-dehydrogenase (NADP+, D-xylono-1,5-lactone-forming)
VSERRLNWGFLSTARINRALMTPLRNSQRNHLLGVASRSEERAVEYAAEWEIPRAYGTYQALLDDPDIDIIYISLPNSLHHHWSVEAARAGKNVLCEKPLALSVEEVDSIAEAARMHGVTVAEAFMYRHHPQTLRIQEMVGQGELGDVRYVRGSFSFPLQDPEDVRLSPHLGGGAIWDLGCYPISYIRTIFGDQPQTVYGEMTPSESGVDQTFIGQLRFSGERYGQFECSFSGPDHWEMEIIGSRGVLFIPSPFKPSFNNHVLLRQTDGAEKFSMPGGELYQGEVEDLADVVLNGSQPRISLEDSRANIEVISGLLQSALEKHPVAITSRNYR